MPRKKKKPSERKYSDKAQEKVHKVMREYEQGKLESGRSHRKVTSREQAIAIGISEARKEGDKVPPRLGRSSTTKRKKAAPKKRTTKKATPKKRTTARKKSAKSKKKK